MTKPVLTVQRWDGLPTSDTVQFASMVDALIFVVSALFPGDSWYPRNLMFGNEVAFYFDEITEARCGYGGYGDHEWEFWLAEARRFDEGNTQ